MITFDCETALIEPGCQAPPLACISTSAGHLIGRVHAEEFAAWMLSQSMRGFAIAFDLITIAANYPRLLPLVFRAYEEDRVSCARTRQQLLDIASGCFRGYYRVAGRAQAIKVEYDLAALALRHYGAHVEKEDTWRLRYGEIMHVPTDAWPEDAKRYALEDALWHERVWQAQEPGAHLLADEYRQARHAFWRGLMRAWGVTTDPAAVERFANAAASEKARLARELVSAGLRRPDRVLKQGKNKGTIKQGSVIEAAVQARVLAAYQARGVEVARTPTGLPSTAKETCEDSGDPVLESLAEYKHFVHVISTEVPILRKGAIEPIHTRYDMIETGRASSSDPNIMNLPREPLNDAALKKRKTYSIDDIIGMRECFVPRPGCLFLAADYSGLELHCWAQVCLRALGYSRMAEVLNAGGDPHLAMACQGLGISYEEGARRRKANDDEIEQQRGSSKIGNFGFQGGMGVDTFIASARKAYGVRLTREVTERLKANWKSTWPEAGPYLRWIGMLCENGSAVVEQLFAKRFRAVDRYAECANGFFQALGADGANEAGFLIARACYLDTRSVLFGSRPALFTHDEFVLEIPDDAYAHERAQELVRLMKLGAAPWLPDVPARVEASLMRRYTKKAKPVYDTAGRLVPWEGKQ